VFLVLLCAFGAWIQHEASFSVSGRVVDGREITVQFAKYGPNAEKM
jgi:hypothetical protein